MPDIVYTDSFSNYAAGPDSPARDAVAVTTSDTDDLVHAARALYVGVTGDVKVNLVGSGTGIVFKAVPAGTVLAIRATRVYATGTTATSIVAMW